MFAPTDEAFGDQAVVDALGAGADVCDVIAGHVLVDTVASAADLASESGTVATTLAGTTVAIEASGGSDDGTGDDIGDDTGDDIGDDVGDDDETGDDDTTITIGGSTIVLADQFATNGVAHVIDTVILPMDDGMEEPMGPEQPPTGTGNPNAGPVETALQSSPDHTDFYTQFGPSFGPSVDDPINTWTVFAPTNEALAGGTLDLQNYIVTTGAVGPDELSGSITTNNGVDHVVTGSAAGGDLAVDGNAVTVLSEGDNSIVYSIDGLLN